jgi:hypothetical protein
MKQKLKERRFDTFEEIQAKSQRVLDTDRKKTSRKRFKNGGGGTGVFMREKATSRVMAADRPYGEFYVFYSVGPEYFGYTIVVMIRHKNMCLCVYIYISLEKDG